ncbi:MAG: SpoIIE family protein phosphatase [Pseudomonadales bacterium]|nr:SpoIIE family protein phosphatase [Pseudomonadales bacterium]
MKSRVPLAIQEHSGATHSMNLLVLDPGPGSTEAPAIGALGNLTNDRLSALGYKTHLTADTTAALEMAEQGSAALVFCCQQNALASLQNLKAGVGLFLVTQEPLSHGALVTAMRAGVVDCWILDQDDQIAAHIDKAINRSAHLLRALNAEVTEMRSELERDQRAGQYIQMGMLPPNPMAIGHFRLQHRVEPSLILSGDFVDYFQITDRYFACYVADVAGHGASSAFVTVLLKNFSRRLRREYRVSMLANPGEILAWINTELIDQGIDKHVAMFLATIDIRENKLHFSNAAHFPPAVIVSEPGGEYLEQKGKPLGLFEGLSFASKHTDFPVGSRLVVFSDGVLDLVPDETILAKEAYLAQAIEDCHSMDTLWARLDTTRIGADDVSCLMIHHGEAKSVASHEQVA